MIRTEVARSLGGFEQEFTGFYEDQAFFCKVYLSHSVLVSEETLARYRIHSDQCCAQVWKAGLYPKYRRLFLDWLRGHLQTQHITDARIWKTLHEAEQSLQLLQEDQDDRLKRGDSRLLRVEKGFEARLESAPDPFDWVRVTIVEAGSGNSYDIQLNLAHLRARVGHRYLLSFKARADAPRSALFGFAQGHSPWANLGCYERIELTPEWQSFSKSFAVAAADENARIHFDLGDVAIPVEFSEITLRDGTAGEMLKSAAPATKNEFSTWWDSE
jgi:hypothetical protein